MRQPKLRKLEPNVRKLDTRIAIPPDKEADAYYSSREHKAWRAAVVDRAGGRCEWTDSGQRCYRAEPQFRMYADHVTEIRDGGNRVGPGRCLCAPHHVLKTNSERARRQRQL